MCSIHRLPWLNLVLAFVWAYHGLVPKLLGPADAELRMTRALDLTREGAILASQIAGGLELAMAACLIVFWRSRWPLQLTVLAMASLLIYVVFFLPDLLLAAFNPVTTNLLMAALALERLHFVKASQA